MRHLTVLLIPTLILVMCATPADAGKKKKKTSVVNGDFAGTVVSVTKGEGTDAPAILTVKVAGPKKKSPPTDQKFELPKGVKLETVTISKKAFGITAAAIEDLKEGERVVIQTKESAIGQADRVLLFSASKKKKQASAN
jgi:hypothetical protein